MKYNIGDIFLNLKSKNVLCIIDISDMPPYSVHKEWYRIKFVKDIDDGIIFSDSEIDEAITSNKWKYYSVNA